MTSIRKNLATNLRPPELLAPAGNLEKAYIALRYGADALYLGLPKLGLRSAPDNFTPDQLQEIIQYAHKLNRKIYLTLNGMLHHEDFDQLRSTVEFLNSIEIDALIVSDLGVIEYLHRHAKAPVHLSTQASCLNSWQARFWQKTHPNLERLILAREASIHQAQLIQQVTGMEVEMFVHGSTCSAYSGSCVISNYTSGRDSNRGGCAHSCRFAYKPKAETKEQSEENQLQIMNSKDILGVRSMAELLHAGIASLKIEGRMKSAMYLAKTVKTYRYLMDTWHFAGGKLCESDLAWAEEELSILPNRGIMEENFKGYPNGGKGSIDPTPQKDDSKHKQNLHNILGEVIQVTAPGTGMVAVKNSFSTDYPMALLKSNDKDLRLHELDFKIEGITGAQIQRTRPNTVVRMCMPKEINIEVGQILYRLPDSLEVGGEAPSC